MKHKILWILIILCFVSPFLLSAEEQELPPGLYASFSTRKGELLFLLDYEGLPRTVSNFVALAEGKMETENPSGPYYTDQKIFREIKGYALFLGDPEGNGDGGVDYTIPREKGSDISTGTSGSLVMVSQNGEDHGSQLMIMIAGDSFLDSKYTAFAELYSGEKTLSKLKRGDTVNSVSILRVGSKAMAFQPDADSVNKMIEEARIVKRQDFAEEHPDVSAVIQHLGDDVQLSETGIFYKIMAKGEGGKPRPGDTVRMHYSGRLLNGQEFDSSYQRGEPFQFIIGVDGVIPGWVETAISMQSGEKRVIILPPELAYGQNGYGPIPPDSWLVFEIELVDFQ